MKKAFDDLRAGDRFGVDGYEGVYTVTSESGGGDWIYVEWEDQYGIRDPSPMSRTFYESWGIDVRPAKEKMPETAAEWDELLRRKTHEALASVFTPEGAQGD